MKRQRKLPNPAEDWLGSYHSALTLADSIEEYWKEAGFRGIKCWLEHREVMRGGETRTLFDIRSNIGPYGFPPLFAEKSAA